MCASFRALLNYVKKKKKPHALKNSFIPTAPQVKHHPEIPGRMVENYLKNRYIRKSDTNFSYFPHLSKEFVSPSCSFMQMLSTAQFVLQQTWIISPVFPLQSFFPFQKKGNSILLQRVTKHPQITLQEWLTGEASLSPIRQAQRFWEADAQLHQSKSFPEVHSRRRDGGQRTWAIIHVYKLLKPLVIRI